MAEKNIIAGRYELIEKIGYGGMAVVYKAKCRLLKRFVAVKILKPEFTHDRKFVENFRREAHASASLVHPNIVSIYDVGRESNINYIVMELVEGKTLSQYIEDEAPIDYKKVVDIGIQVAKGLSTAHKNGIIHRDIKPHNILINKDGIAKITDFGIARAVTDTTIVDTSKDNIMGSVHYFSPEQAKGTKIDAKSDIYSFGIMLYEMITGKIPFDGDTPVAVALKHINEPITPPSVYNQETPHGLEKIILKSTEKEEKNRYDSFDEIIDELDEIDTISRVVGNSILKAGDDSNVDYISGGVLGRNRGKKDKKKDNRKEGSKNKRLYLFGGILIGTLLLAITTYFVLFSGNKVTVPDFKGMTIEEAEEKAKPLNLKVEISSYKSSNEIRKDLILEQDPEPNKKVKENTTIKVIVSKGNTKGIVPNVTGRPLKEAKKTIEQYGFTLGEIKEIDSDKPKDEVVEQSPNGGSNAGDSTKVDLVVSNGKKPKVEVPNLLGMDEATAKEVLESKGFVLGNVSKGKSTQYEAYTIIWQSEDAGSKLEKGKKIDIKINASSIGSVSINLPLSESEKEDFILNVVVTDERGVRTVIANQEYNKNGKATLKVDGYGSGVISVTFDGVEVLRKEVQFTQ